ncbi:hypothetical protein GTA08_BOTSDO10937 [Botryosphaeria dothidea]|uniref:Uncharacterized protein n=1 Tax=Botryosphaeria dothidea TaxID=55169 RepID=A0A8H4IGX6_9PEZI|nr:hypothetical protein GTA08_BOTSDO10937 [Botryosphaeria dothidea]
MFVILHRGLPLRSALSHLPTLQVDYRLKAEKDFPTRQRGLGSDGIVPSLNMVTKDDEIKNQLVSSVPKLPAMCFVFPNSKLEKVGKIACTNVAPAPILLRA